MSTDNPPTETRESGIAIGALVITRRVILAQGKDDLSFQVPMDATASRQDMFEIMDNISAVAERERWKAELRERQDALKANTEQPDMTRREILRLREEKARFLASLQAAHSAMKRRTPFELTEKHRADAEKYDAAIKGMEESLKSFTADRPIIEWQIACLEAKIAGETEPPAPEALAERLADLAMSQAEAAE